MKKLALVALTLVVLVASQAAAQDIKPQGFGPTAPAAVPATTPAPTSAPTVGEPLVSVKDFNAAITSFRKRLEVVEKKIEDINKVPSTPANSDSINYVLPVVITLVVIGGMVWIFLRRRKGTARTRRGTSAIVFLIGLSLAATVNAAPAAPATCTIRAITTGEIIVIDQEPAAITIAVRNCTDVTSIVTPDPGVTFTDVKSVGNTVTAKVTATTSTKNGPKLIKLTLADKTETVSPDTAFIIVLDPGTATVNKTAAAANSAAAKVAADVKMLKATTEKSLNGLNLEVTARPTTTEVNMAIDVATKDLKSKIADLELVIPSLVDEMKTNNAAVAQLAQATAFLAGNQETLANTKVTKGGFLGFGGKKILNPEVAEAAERIRQAIAKTFPESGK